MNVKSDNCTKCGLFAELVPANISHKTGERLYRSWCKLCEHQRKTEWRTKNKDKHNEKCRLWVKNNPEKRAAISKTYADTHKEEAVVYRKAYKQLYKERTRSYCSARRKRVQQATPSWQNLRELVQIYEQAQQKSLISGIKYHVDHIIPLKHKDVCGLHVPWNLQLLPELDNLKKRNKLV